MGELNSRKKRSSCILTPVLSQVIYNEGWGQLIDGYPEYNLTARVKQLDPSRLVDSTTGWYDHGAGDYSVRMIVK